MYRPNFCAECGEKILRLRWHLWTSRKFCDGCTSLLRKTQLVPFSIAAISLLIVGMGVGRATQTMPPPVVIQRAVPPPLADVKQVAGIAPAGSPSDSTKIEDVYMCGARTKKGTPCTRRVHGYVRCWQHKGLPAMLAKEKLLIKE